MTLLILGLALWWAIHLLPVSARGMRDALAARLGENGWKALFSLVSVGAIVLLAIGYQRADYEELWLLPPWATHVNNALMVVAVILFAGAHSRGNLKRFVRHPQLWSVIVWAFAHLLVNGDVASLVLFGGLGAWAATAIVATNRRDGVWVKPGPAPWSKDVLLAAIAIFAYVVIVAVHAWIGPSPLPG